MSSQYSSLPVKTNTPGDVAVEIVDAGGVNKLAIDAHGSASTELKDASGNAFGTSGNPIYVNTGAGAAGTLKNSGQLKAAALAANSTSTLSAAAITAAKTGNFLKLICSGSGAARFDFQEVSNAGTPTTLFSLFTTASSPNAEYAVFSAGEIALAAADGTNAKYQVIVNNNDANALDFYVYISWSEQ